MIAYLKRRRWRKAVRQCLQHARHCRAMREDIAAAADLAELDRRERELEQAWRGGAAADIEPAIDGVMRAAARVMPPRRLPWLSENIEMLVVAIAVAIAFRTYAIQPFKIPTGSMQPTLFGITSEAVPPRWTDRKPFSYLKWIVTGESYWDVRAAVSGTVGDAATDAWDPSIVWLPIGGRAHKLPIDAWQRREIPLMPGQMVFKGTRLWSGRRRAGDHVFVNRVAWNFVRPRRGQVMVFDTEAIPTLPPGTHYIKRLIALPGETVSFDPPDVLIDGAPLAAPEAIARIARRAPGYDGFQLADRRSVDPALFYAKADRLVLGATEFFGLGDNTGNSRDSRYWGPVPRRNLVGPAAWIYWPFSRRWGPLR